MKNGNVQTKKKERNALGMKKILVIQTAFLGDVILSTAFFRALAALFPEASVDAVTIPSTQIVFRHFPAVRRVWTLDKNSTFRKMRDFLRLAWELRRERYAAAVSLQLHATSSLLMIAAGIPVRVGFRRQKGLTHPVVPPKGLHMRLRYLTLLSPWTNRTFDDRTELVWSDAEERVAEGIAEPLRKRSNVLVGVAPGSVWPTKRWPSEYYSELATGLAKRGIVVVGLGGREDRALCDEALAGTEGRSRNCAGELSVLESAALIRRLDALVTNDTAPLHIADAVGTPVFALFGPTVRRFGCTPYRPDDRVFEVDLDCRPCSKHGGRRCPRTHFRCMRDLKPETVLDAVLHFLESHYA
jgi:heptosyltransferase-2